MNKVIILAAGKGTRMDSDLPKVLVPINGEPMIKYLIDSVIKSGITDKPILVVSPDNKEIIQEALKNYNLDYAIQEEQLGTGHAVASGKNLVSKETDKVITFYGDHPFLHPESIKKLTEIKEGVLTMMTTALEDFNDWRKNFYHWGRIVRNENNEVKEIVEFKDSNDRQKEIKEVNPGLLCFDSKWLWENIENLKNNNKQAEYYLTDLVKTAFEQNYKIKTSKIKPEEALGINSKEELELAEKLT